MILALILLFAYAAVLFIGYAWGNHEATERAIAELNKLPEEKVDENIQTNTW